MQCLMMINDELNITVNNEEKFNGKIDIFNDIKSKPYIKFTQLCFYFIAVSLQKIFHTHVLVTEWSCGNLHWSLKQVCGNAKLDGEIFFLQKSLRGYLDG